jgi:hypothetical protein
MAKKRTGLQSEIAGIFSGVPIPKKGGTRSKSESPATKPEGPAKKPVDPAKERSGSVISKPVTPQPQVPVAPAPKKIEEPFSAAPKPKVVEVKAPEQFKKKIPKKIKRRRKEKIFAPKSGVGSSRQKAGIILFILFSSALVIVLLRSYLPTPGNPPSPQPGATEDNGNATMANNIEIDWPVPSVYSANLRDPMNLGSPRQIIVETAEGVVVRGIVVSEDRKYAVIGTKYLQEGGIVPGTKIRVKTINPNSVEFEEDGKKWTQKVQGDKR